MLFFLAELSCHDLFIWAFLWMNLVYWRLFEHSLLFLLYHHYLVVSYCVFDFQALIHPPEEHLMESSNDPLVDDIEAESINGAG